MRKRKLKAGKGKEMLMAAYGGHELIVGMTLCGGNNISSRRPMFMVIIPQNPD
jgi:hypothetical protein